MFSCMFGIQINVIKSAEALQWLNIGGNLVIIDEIVSSLNLMAYDNFGTKNCYSIKFSEAWYL
jgi:hypothetical protein